MKICLTGLIIVSVLLSSSCQASSSITGTVIDAETNKPIEGAVVLVEWKKTEGVPGMTATVKYKVDEVVTDKEGNFLVEGVSAFFVNPPRVTIYKKGYVAWNNEYIFPGWMKRKQFKWEEKTLIRMSPFKQEYSRADHVYFLHNVTHWGKLINEAYRWEELGKENQ